MSGHRPLSCLSVGLVAPGECREEAPTHCLKSSPRCAALWLDSCQASASVLPLGSRRAETFLQGEGMSGFGPGPTTHSWKAAWRKPVPLPHRWLNLPEGAFLDPGDSWVYLGQQNEAGRCSQALIQGIPSPGYAAVTPVLTWTRGLHEACHSDLWGRDAWSDDGSPRFCSSEYVKSLSFTSISALSRLCFWKSNGFCFENIAVCLCIHKASVGILLPYNMF